MERDLTIMLMFLAITQEILNRYKRGQRLTIQEKVMFFMFFARTVESWQRISVLTCRDATLRLGESKGPEAIENGGV